MRLPMSLDRRRDHHPRSLAGAVLLAGAALAWPQPAAAQTSAALALASSYDARGIALSRHPVAQLRVDHDADDGWYVGGFASPVNLGPGSAQGQLIAYAGRASQLASGLSWDAGVSQTLFLRDGRYDYREFYAGLATDHASARIFLSPAYYGEGRSAYLDLNGFRPLSERVRFTVHAGLLHAVDAYREAARNRVDVRVALTLDLDEWQLQAGLQTLLHAGDDRVARAHALAASATLRF